MAREFNRGEYAFVGIYVGDCLLFCFFVDVVK